MEILENRNFKKIKVLNNENFEKIIKIYEIKY
jgi:hypothetical protein